MSGSDLCIPRNETAQPRYFQNRIIMFCLSISRFMYLWAIYTIPSSICRGWSVGIYINRSQIHECRNWKKLSSAVSFLEIYMFRIFSTGQPASAWRGLDKCKDCEWYEESSRQSLNFSFPSGIATHDLRCMHFVNPKNKRGASNLIKQSITSVRICLLHETIKHISV